MEVDITPARAATVTANPLGSEKALAGSRPLVSVIIRTMGRDELIEALDSVSGQTYTHIEVILCDAKGQGELPSQDACGSFPVRIASTGTPLGRGAAANVGLEAAAGDYVVFLDDDDWFLPDHVASLVDAVQSCPDAAAAYAGIVCRTKNEAGDWESVYVFNQPYDPVRLLVENYLPMHSVLFSRRLVGDRLRFDESLDVYEDWDFWIQLSALTDFVHVDRVTAIYRVAGGSGFGVRETDPAVDPGKAVLFEKWRSRWSLDQVLMISDYAKYRPMYHELVHDHEWPADATGSLTGHLGQPNSSLDRMQWEIECLKVQNHALERRTRAAEIERNAGRELLGVMHVESIDDAMEIRWQLADYQHARQGLDDLENRALTLSNERQETLRLVDNLEKGFATQLNQANLETGRLRMELGLSKDECVALKQQHLVLGERYRSVEMERDANLQWLKMVQVASLDDALLRRDQLSDYDHIRFALEDLKQRIHIGGDEQQQLTRRILALVERMQGPMDGLQHLLDQIRGSFVSQSVGRIKRVLGTSVVAKGRLVAGREHVRHLRVLVREYGPITVSRSVFARFRPKHSGSTPNLAALWHAVSYQRLDFDIRVHPTVSILLDWKIGQAHVLELLSGLAGLQTTLAFEVLLVHPKGDVIAERLTKTTRGLRALPVVPSAQYGERVRAALDAATGDWMLLASTPYITPTDWVKLLLETAQRIPSTGAVCAKVVGRDGALIHAGGIRCQDGQYKAIGMGDDPEAPEYNFVREVDIGSQSCLLLNRKAMQEADSSSVSSAENETGLVEPLERMRSQGWRVFYQPGVQVCVQEVATRECAGEVFEAGNKRRRVLVVDAVMLTPDQDSGSLRMVNLLESFLDLGWHVSFVPSNLEFQGHYGRQLQQRGVEVFSSPQVQSIGKLLEERGRTFDVVVLSRADVAGPLLESVRLHAPDASVWYDTVDLHFLREQREAELRNDPAARERALRRKVQEISLMQKADCTLVVSSVERDLLATEVPDARVAILSNIHDLQPTDSPYSERDAIVFIGGFNHPPNVDAMVYYVTEILPLVSAQLGVVPTYIIGSQAPAEILELGDVDRGIFVTGFVPDVTSYFSRARLSVAPLRYGAGVKGKVNMSMAYGVPVVASPCAAEGMFLEPERDILIGEDAQAFSDQVVRLYLDQHLWQALSQNGLVNVSTHFSRDSARTAIKDLLADLVK